MKPTDLYNYPKDRIEIRKLVRQLRNLQLHGVQGVPILSDADIPVDMLKRMATLENEIVVEAARRHTEPNPERVSANERSPLASNACRDSCVTTEA